MSAEIIRLHQQPNVKGDAVRWSGGPLGAKRLRDATRQAKVASWSLIVPAVRGAGEPVALWVRDRELSACRDRVPA